jgi:hypothetical protein
MNMMFSFQDFYHVGEPSVERGEIGQVLRERLLDTCCSRETL